MFGQNQTVNRKFFTPINPDFQEGKLLVTSVFITLQGEGPLAGRTAAFVRLAKCSIACAMCDTYFESGKWLSVEEILKQIDEQLAIKNLPHPECLIITGGEPTLQDTYLLEGMAAAHFKYVQIESHGLLTFKPRGSTMFVISPKINDKTKKYMKANETNLERADCLKFLVAHPSSGFGYYSEIPDWALAWKDKTNRDIYISPINEYSQQPEQSEKAVTFWDPDLLNKQANQLNHEYAATYCMRYGLRLSLQLHLYASLP